MAIVLKKKKRAIGAVTGFRRRAAEVTLLRPGWVPKTPPCTFACPNGNEIRACLTTIAQTESSDATLEEVMEKAWYTLVNTNPFPSVCGQVCPHPCETDCNRNEKDEAVNTRRSSGQSVSMGSNTVCPIERYVMNPTQRR